MPSTVSPMWYVGLLNRSDYAARLTLSCTVGRRRRYLVQPHHYPRRF